MVADSPHFIFFDHLPLFRKYQLNHKYFFCEKALPEVLLFSNVIRGRVTTVLLVKSIYSSVSNYNHFLFCTKFTQKMAAVNENYKIIRRLSQ